jgi:hypothetical protein
MKKPGDEPGFLLLWSAGIMPAVSESENFIRG